LSSRLLWPLAFNVFAFVHSMPDKLMHTENLQNELKRHQDRLTFSASSIQLPIVCCCKTSQPLWTQRVQVQILKCWRLRCRWCVHGPADATAIPSSHSSLKLILGHYHMPDCSCFFVEKGHYVSVFNVNKIECVKVVIIACWIEHSAVMNIFVA